MTLLGVTDHHFLFIQDHSATGKKKKRSSFFSALCVRRASEENLYNGCNKPVANTNRSVTLPALQPFTVGLFYFFPASHKLLLPDPRTLGPDVIRSECCYKGFSLQRRLVCQEMKKNKAEKTLKSLSCRRDFQMFAVRYSATKSNSNLTFFLPCSLATWSSLIGAGKVFLEGNFIRYSSLYVEEPGKCCARQAARVYHPASPHVIKLSQLLRLAIES